MKQNRKIELINFFLQILKPGNHKLLQKKTLLQLKNNLRTGDPLEI